MLSTRSYEGRHEGPEKGMRDSLVIGGDKWHVKRREGPLHGGKPLYVHSRPSEIVASPFVRDKATP